MNASPILQQVAAKVAYVEFDPTNFEHMDAFNMVVYNNRQHPTLRFALKYPYHDIRVMMLEKVGKAYTDHMALSNKCSTIQ